jgi:hypothetical protein
MGIFYSAAARGFFDSEIHATIPAGAVAISAEAHRALLDAQAQGKEIVPGEAGEPMLADPVPRPAPAPAPYIAKTAILRRATDAEIEEFETWLIGAATARQRLMWQDAEGGLVEIAAVRPIVTAMFGEARAAVLLAPV